MPKATDRVLLVIDDEKHLVDPSKLLLGEIIAAEKATGLVWPQIWVGVNAGHAQAIQAVVWLMRRRSNPKLRLSEVEFAMGDYRLKDPDFDPEYWVPDGDGDELPESARLIDEAFEPGDEQEHVPEAPKAEERPQDTPQE
jgi:hypothetical protein